MDLAGGGLGRTRDGHGRGRVRPGGRDPQCEGREVGITRLTGLARPASLPGTGGLGPDAATGGDWCPPFPPEAGEGSLKTASTSPPPQTSPRPALGIWFLPFLYPPSSLSPSFLVASRSPVAQSANPHPCPSSGVSKSQDLEPLSDRLGLDFPMGLDRKSGRDVMDQGSEGGPASVADGRWGGGRSRRNFRRRPRVRLQPDSAVGPFLDHTMTCLPLDTLPHPPSPSGTLPLTFSVSPASLGSDLPRSTDDTPLTDRGPSLHHRREGPTPGPQGAPHP